MFKAMNFKGNLSDAEMKEIQEFKGKNVELLIREIPSQNSHQSMHIVRNCKGMTGDQIMRMILHDIEGMNQDAKG